MNEATHIKTIRRFNRYYTKVMGGLDEYYLQSPHSITELRILHELATTPGITAKELAERLAMDHGFLSRTIAALTRKKMITRTHDALDRRALHLTLTPDALAQQPAIERAADEKVAQLLTPIPPEKQAALVNAIETIMRILEPQPAPPMIFRQLAPGDAGWIVHRHGVMITKEFGWNMEFEALCAQILSDFIRNYQPEWERSWIAERGGEILGSLFLIRQDEQTAKLRMLYVEPAARGMGLATKLLEKSIQFARSKSYKRVTLFTTSGNLNARRIYVKLGMTLTNEEPLDFAGQALVGETWEMALV